MPSKKHHYVPQFYLRHFAVEPPEEQREGEKLHIYCFNKEMGQARKCLISQVAHENHFHDYRADEGETISLEGLTSNLETILSPSLAALCVDRSPQALDQHKRALSIFMAFQLLRTASFREDYRQWQDGVRKAFRERGVEMSTELVEQTGITCLDDVTDAEAITLHLAAMTNSDVITEIARIFQAKRWLLVRVNADTTKARFWTSDYPVVLMDQNHNITTPGAKIFVPVDPTLGFVLCDHGASWDNKDGEISCMNGEMVELFNGLHVFWSRRFLFSAKDDFSFAKRVLAKYPDWKNAHRQRIEVIIES